MEQERNKLYAFGYGLAALIPYFLAMGILKYQIAFIWIIAILIFLLYVISHIERLKTIYYLLLIWFFYVAITQGELTVKSYILFALSGMVLYITIKNVELLEQFYRRWMSIAHFIGTALNFLVLVVLFYIVFAPVGIVLRIIRKDLLDQKIDGKKKSYWIPREEKSFNPESYKKQF